ncbi:MAG TPA: DUF2207 domain-containing protein [Marmoricola sp.]|jgi:uncharacterized membrane protein YgcG|nr:DUF2207 domain-containing protein [Marmoricola sp.]
MKKVVAWVLGLIVLAAVVGIGAINLDSSKEDPTPDPSTITSYDADFLVTSSGVLEATETLTVDFNESKHGIFRFFDVRDPHHPKNRLIPTNISVSMDGVSEPFSVLTQGRGRYRNIKIGDPDTTIIGSHTYKIGYTINGVLTPAKGSTTPTQFYWNLIPAGWAQNISASILTVHLPANADTLKCTVGLGVGQTCDTTGADATSRITGQGTKTVVVTTGPLDRNTPVTIAAGMDIPTPAADTRPWSSTVDAMLGNSVPGLIVVLVLAGLAAAAGALLSISTREKPPGLPLMYAPPDGIGPAEAAYILNETVDNKTFVATLMHAAENKAVDLQLSQDGWTVTGAADTTTWTKIDGVTQLTLQSLGINAPGASFTATSKSVSAGQKLKSAISSFNTNTEGWAKMNGLMINSGLGPFSWLIIAGVWVVAVVIGCWNPFDMSIIALIPGMFGLTGLSLAFAGAGTKRTPEGRELWSRVGGFHRILSTDSAEARFDFAGKKDLYTTYLPWAVAFDCADKWAAKYKLATAEEPPTPFYFAGYGALYAGSMVNQMVDTFDSSVSSAISAYQATQSSSSGGGGGFSGGGGGGGGGGGSW